MKPPVDLNVSIKNLHPEQQAKMREWNDTLTNDEGVPKGLWIWGKRNSGTSYVGRVALRRLLVGETPPLITVWERLTALELMEHIRKVWSFSTATRQHADDWGLWEDMSLWEEQLTFLWNECTLLWIDNFHADTMQGGSMDPTFWRKHIHPQLERRQENGLITIVSTTLAPKSSDLPGVGVIEKFFVPVFCDR